MRIPYFSGARVLRRSARVHSGPIAYVQRETTNMACRLPTLHLDHSSTQPQIGDGAAKLSARTDQKKMLKIDVADWDVVPKTPCSSQASHPSPSQASTPESQSQGTPPPVSPQPRKDVPKSFLCPISLDLMKDPVILVETMQTYDRTSICRWFDWGGAICPVAGKQLVSQEMVNNPTLRSAINEWKESGWKNTTKTAKKTKGQKQPSTYTHLRRPPPANHPCAWRGEAPCGLVHVPSQCNPGHGSTFVVQNHNGFCASTQASLRQPSLPPNDVTGLLAGHMLQQKPDVTPQADGISAVLANEVFHGRASVFARDHAGWTALHWAAKEDDIEAVQLLIQLGARSQQASTKEVFVEGLEVSSGANPLHVAAIFGSDRAAQVLIECGADVDAMSNFGTPMHLAVWHGHFAVIEVLAWNGANVNARNGHMETPLHLAIELGDSSLVEVLVRCGADGWAVNGQGKNAPELVTNRCNYFDKFSNLSPLDEFKMMEFLEQRPIVGVSMY